MPKPPATGDLPAWAIAPWARPENSPRSWCPTSSAIHGLTGADEDRILARLRALRSDLIDPTIAVHHGRVVKRTGDGSIVEFRSVVDAVRCAIEVSERHGRTQCWGRAGQAASSFVSESILATSSRRATAT